MPQASEATIEDAAPADIVGREEQIAPAPRVSVQAFCETVDTAAAIQAAGEDRRMAKAHLRIQMGGLTAAVEAYQSSPTPNVIILESENRGDDILGSLDKLAEHCDPGTRVVVIARANDVMLYRELVRRGVSDYLIAPVGALQVVRSVCGLFSAPDAKPVGRVIAVVGAKGGVGASTIAHNVAFSIARDLKLDSVVTDLDGPHQWAGWTKQTLIAADDILIVAAPDLANLRNAKNMYDLLKASRPNDHRPLYCLNQVGVPS